MEFNFRTDLAIETREAYQKAKQMDIPGVEVENLTDTFSSMNVKIILILNAKSVFSFIIGLTAQILF